MSRVHIPEKIPHNVFCACMQIAKRSGGKTLNITFDAVYYEAAALAYPLGRQLLEKYRDLP